MMKISTCVLPECSMKEEAICLFFGYFFSFPLVYSEYGLYDLFIQVLVHVSVCVCRPGCRDSFI